MKRIGRVLLYSLLLTCFAYANKHFRSDPVDVVKGLVYRVYPSLVDSFQFELIDADADTGSDLFEEIVQGVQK